MNPAYRSLAGRIQVELEEIDRVADRTERIWEQARQTDNDFLVDAAALNLHGFYAGIERIFELVAHELDQYVPSGANWHQQLLRQMSSQTPGVRPAVLTGELRDRLDPYRGFRHVVRNVYTHNLIPEQVGLLVRQLPGVTEAVKQELGDFAAFLESLASGS